MKSMLILLVVLCLSFNCFGRGGLWIEPQIGSSSSMLGAGIGAFAQNGFFTAGLEASAYSEFCIMCQASNEATVKSVLTGVSLKEGALMLAVFTGISKVDGIKARGDYKSSGWFSASDNFTSHEIDSWGIPVKMSLALAGRFIGIGMNLNFVLGPDLPLAGFTLAVPFGKLPSSKTLDRSAYP